LVKKNFVALLVAATLVTQPAPGATKPSYELVRGFLEPVVARAERPTRIVAEVRNNGASLAAVEVTLTLPAVVTNASPQRNMTTWKKGEVKSFAWDVVAATPLRGVSTLQVRQGDNVLASLEFPVVWREVMALARADYVPVPQPVDTAPYLVGAVHCPLWNDGRRWNDIAPYPDREPVLGWYDEGTPEVTDWEIKYALDHGISFFMVCWYRAKDGIKPVKPALGHWLHDGLFQSRYGDQIKFAIMFENGNKAFPGQTSERDLLDNLLPFWIENYFSRSNYLVLDGKPVFSFYDMKRLVENLGGEKQTRAVLDRMRAACRRAGFKGLHILGQYCWGNSDELRAQGEQIQRLGMDASWNYHWPTFTGAFGEQLQPSGDLASAAQERLWRTQPQPNLLTISMGWDSQPWRFSYSRAQWRLTPDEFQTLAARAKALLDERGGDGIANRLVLLDNWNEYGEGHYIFPHREHGFGYLDAVRAVFAPGATPHTNLVPADVARGPYDAKFRAFPKRASSRN